MNASKYTVGLVGLGVALGLVGCAGERGDQEEASMSSVEQALEACDMGTWEGDFTGHPAALQGYTRVVGDLTVVEESATDMSDLSCLTEVVGGVRISKNPNLTSLDGLNNLERVAHSLTVDLNPNMAHIEALSNLTEVGWNLRVRRNKNLITLDGLNSLQRVGATINVKANYKMTDITGLYESLTYADAVTITKMSALCPYAIDAFRVTLNARMDVNPTYGDITTDNVGACPCDKGEWAGDFSGPPVLLWGYTSVAGEVGLDASQGCAGYDCEDAQPTDLEPLSCLQRADTVTVYAQPNLVSLSGLEGLEEATVLVYSNPELIDVSGLSGMSSGTIRVGSNSALQRVELGFESFDGTLAVHGPNMTSLALPNLTTITYLEVQRTGLSNFNGLSRLVEVGTLRVWNNSSLSNISGLSSLVEVNEGLLFSDNRRLCSGQIDALFERLVQQPAPGSPSFCSDPDTPDTIKERYCTYIEDPNPPSLVQRNNKEFCF